MDHSAATQMEEVPPAGTSASFFRRFFLNGWRLSAFIVSLFVIIPLGVIFCSWLTPAGGIWTHLFETVLSELFLNTLWLVLGVSTGTIVLGVTFAWLTAVCEFPGRKFFSWSLLLPLAMPTYVLAFASLGILDYAGPVQTLYRSWFGSGAWFPDFRSTGGVILVMSLAFYPYVYLLTKNAFLTQGRRALEAAQSLGHSRTSGFFRVALPMARPWIAGGVTLVLMETLADFGAVSIFNYDTFTTAIYKAWFGFFSLAAAAQISSILVLIVSVLIFVERQMRSRMRFTPSGKGQGTGEKIVLGPLMRWAAFLFALFILSIAFIIPTVQLCIWSLEIYHLEFSPRYFQWLQHSLTLGLSGSFLICLLALVLAYARRRNPDKLTGALVRISTLGYALPGTVLAVGIFIPVAALDNLIIALARDLFGVKIGMLINGTVLIMLIAYLVRFMAAGYNSIDSSMHRVTPSIDEAARLMGMRGLSILKRIHFPIVRGGVMTAASLVFVDIMKEMPITLMTRPFGWDTLSVKIFELTSEGEWERAALPSVILVLAGLIPIFLLIKSSEK